MWNLVEEKKHFDASFDYDERIWTARWKWTLNTAPTLLRNQIAEYKIPDNIKGEYKRELQVWIMNSWLIPYLQERLGPPKGLIPLMAMVQHAKGKVYLVMEYRELNKHVDAFTADADVYSQIEGVTSARCERGIAWPMEGLFTNTSSRVYQMVLIKGRGIASCGWAFG